MVHRSLFVSLVALSWNTAALAQVCPNVDNLVANCGFGVDTAGYAPQLPGDSIVHVPSLGATALGSMRVIDSQADSDSEAEAEHCVSLGSVRHFSLHAQFLAANADTCFVGFDEFTDPDCLTPNGNYVSSPAVSVNSAAFTSFSSRHSVGDAVQSVELVILCQLAGGGDAEFVVDDVGLVSDLVFANSFE
jgi:hypothetical protein